MLWLPSVQLTTGGFGGWATPWWHSNCLEWLCVSVCVCLRMCLHLCLGVKKFLKVFSSLLWIFLFPTARNYEKEIVHTFYVEEVAVTETQHTQMIHNCSLLVHFHPRHIFLAQLCTKSKHLFCLFGRPVMMLSSPALTCMAVTTAVWWGTWANYLFFILGGIETAAAANISKLAV